jgi:hypothetical protein
MDLQAGKGEADPILSSGEVRSLLTLRNRGVAESEAE